MVRWLGERKLRVKSQKYSELDMKLIGTLVGAGIFLAAKCSSTLALFFCLSVCPSISKLNFSLFGQPMTTYDN